MRISDWSSDVCSSDLGISAMAMGLGQLFAPLLLTGTMAWFTADGAPVHFPGAAFIVAAVFGLLAIAMLRHLPRATERSEERRVGKECVSTCRSRWST